MHAMTKRKTSFDMIKIVLTILIVFHHYCQSTGAWFVRGINFANGYFPFGYLVEFFFLISGMMMYKYVDIILKREIGFRKFFISRYSRLIPLVSISAIFYVIVDRYVYYYINYSFFADISPVAWGVVLDMLGFQGGWLSESQYMINNPTWYVSTLLLCYVFFYFLTEISSKKDKDPWKFYAAMIIVGIAEWVVWNLTGFQIPFLNSASARGFYSFFFGLILARLLEKRCEPNKRKWFHYLFSVFFAISSLIAIGLGLSFLLPIILTLITYPSILFILTGMENTIIFRKFSCIWSFLAKTSYSVYIWHVHGLMIMFWLDNRFGLVENWNNPIVMIIFAGVMEIIAIPSYLFLERKLNPKFEKLLNCLLNDNK